MTSLYERLNTINPRKKPQIVDALLMPDIAPSVYFAGERIWQMGRDGLSARIAEYLRGRGTQINDPDFANKIYYSFTSKRSHRRTTEPLLVMHYGRIYGDYLPDDVFQSLEDWEALYLLPGILDGRSSGFIGNRFTQTKLGAWSIREIMARIIIAGVRKLEQYEKYLGKTLPRKKIILEACDDALKTQLDLEIVA